MAGCGVECQPKRGHMARALWDPLDQGWRQLPVPRSFRSDPGGTAPTLAKLPV